MKRFNRLILAACLAVVWPTCAQGVKALRPEDLSSPDYGLRLNKARQELLAEREQRRKLEQEAAAERKRVKELEDALRREREARVAPPRVIGDPPTEKSAPSAADPRGRIPVETKSGAILDCPEMVLIPAGEKIIRSFLLCKTEVSQGQWRAVMGSNPPKLAFKTCGDDCPVERVSWNDAQAFIKKLNEQTGKSYRLPSEAEWEYACRAGGRHSYCGSDDIGVVAWYDENSDNKPHPVDTVFNVKHFLSNRAHMAAEF